MQRLFCGLLLLTLGLLLNGCGFHLRGHEPLPATLQTLYIQTTTPYSVLIKELENTLKRSGVVVVPEPDQARVTLKIVSEADTQQITGVSTSGQTTTYTLYYTVVFQLLDDKGNSLLAPQSVTVTRNLSIVTNQILSGTSMQKSLQTDMRRDAVFQILNRLRSRGVERTLQQKVGVVTVNSDDAQSM